MASYEQYLQRQENINQIISCLRLSGDKTRRQLCEELSLSWGCISELASLLIQSGILLEKKAEGGTQGRTPLLLTLNTQKFVLGIDVNNMGISCCVCDSYGNIVKTQKKIFNLTDKAALLESVKKSAADVVDNFDDCIGVGIAMQGLCEDGERWNFPSENGTFTVENSELERLFDLPVHIEHDPNCILLGISKQNETETHIMVRVDNSIGMAMHTKDGFLKNGGMELAHTVMVPDGKPCSCGHNGCLQTLCSINGIVRSAGVSIDCLAKAAVTDANARKYFTDAGKYLGTALGNVCNLFFIDRISLCGELINYKDLFSDALKNSFNNTALHPQKTTLVYSNIADAAYGAAKLSLINCFLK